MGRVVDMHKDISIKEAQQLASAAKPHSSLESVLRQIRLISGFGQFVTIAEIDPKVYTEVVDGLRKKGYKVSFEAVPAHPYLVPIEIDWFPFDQEEFEEE